MTLVAMVEAARQDGVTVALSSADAIKLGGDRLAVQRWFPVIRQNKPAILAVLLEEAAAVNGDADDRPAGLLPANADGACQAGLPPRPACDLPHQDDDLRRCRSGPGASHPLIQRPIEGTRLSTFDDERRTCSQCRNLLPNGQCVAAARGELNATRTYAPVQDLLQRCAGFLPEPNDPDQRSGRERHWPA